MTIAKQDTPQKLAPLFKVKTGLKVGLTLNAEISSDTLPNAWNSVKSTYQSASSRIKGAMSS